jgi:hypothetical protein
MFQEKRVLHGPYVPVHAYGIGFGYKCKSPWRDPFCNLLVDKALARPALPVRAYAARLSNDGAFSRRWHS